MGESIRQEMDGRWDKEQFRDEKEGKEEDLVEDGVSCSHFDEKCYARTEFMYRGNVYLHGRPQ